MVGQSSQGVSDAEQLAVVSKVQQDEQTSFLIITLILFSVFNLAIAASDYYRGDVGVMSTSTVLAGMSIILLVLFQLGAETLLKLIQWLSGLMLIASMYLFLFAWQADELGLMAAVCFIPGLISVLGYRCGARLLALNLVGLLLIRGEVILPQLNARLAPDVWNAYFCGYIALSVFCSFLDLLRERHRHALIKVTHSFKPQIVLDELSGLPHRREMERHLGGSLNRYHLSREPFSVISANIDDFKHLNEKYGHKFGDQFIREAAKVLQKALRTDDVVARWGGDDFLILLPQQKIEAARQIAERLRKNIGAIKRVFSGDDVQITMSFGVACIEGLEGCDELVAAADRGLYQAKNMGKDLVVSG